MKSLLQFTFLALIKSSSQFQYATHVEKQIKFPFNMLVLINPKGKFCIQFGTYKMSGVTSIQTSLYIYISLHKMSRTVLSRKHIQLHFTTMSVPHIYTDNECWMLDSLKVLLCNQLD